MALSVLDVVIRVSVRCSDDECSGLDVTGDPDATDGRERNGGDLRYVREILA